MPNRIPQIIRENSRDIAQGMQHLSEAVRCLSRARDNITKSLQSEPHGSDTEPIAIAAERGVKFLTSAACAVPNEYWYIALDLDTVDPLLTSATPDAIIDHIANRARQLQVPA